MLSLQLTQPPLEKTLCTHMHGLVLSVSKAHNQRQELEQRLTSRLRSLAFLFLNNSLIYGLHYYSTLHYIIVAIHLSVPYFILPLIVKLVCRSSSLQLAQSPTEYHGFKLGGSVSHPICSDNDIKHGHVFPSLICPLT